MNEYQRGILVIGAVILLSVALNAPTVQMHRGTIYTSGALADTVASVVDWRTTLTHGFMTLGVTALLWVALRNLGAKKKEAAASQCFTAVEIRAESFKLIDKNGKCLVRLEVQEDGRLILSRTGANGSMWTSMIVDAAGNFIQPSSSP